MNRFFTHGVPMLLLAVAVQEANAVALLNDDEASTSVDTAIEIPVLDNDTSDYGGLQVLLFESTTQQGGTISVGEGGGVFYTPPSGFEGTDVFTYSATNNFGEYGGPATVTVTVGEESDDYLGKTKKVIDKICARVSNGDLEGISQSIIDACNSGTPTSEQLAEISPEEILVLRHMVSNFTQSQSGRIYQHQDALRTSRLNNPVTYRNQELMLNTYWGGSAGEAQNSPWGVFGSVHTDNGDHDQTDFESEYESTSYGLTVGVDYRLSPALFVGAAFDWTSADVDYTSNDGNVESDIYNVTGFLTWLHNQFSVDAQLGYATSDISTKRNITFPTNDVAKGETDSDQFTLSLQGDWTWAYEAWSVRPYLRLDYLTATIDGYTETGSSPWLMEIGDQDVDQTTATLGVDTRYSMSRDWGVFVPGLKLAAVSESSSDYSPVNFHLVGVEGSDGAFTLQPDTEDSLFYQCELSAVFVLKSGWSTFVTGQFITGYDDFSAYQFAGGFRKEI